jgi:hypothetical protein
MKKANKQELREFLINDISLESLQEFTKQFEVNKNLFVFLFEILKENDPQLSWRAAWAIWHLFKNRKDILDLYIAEITELLPKLPIDGQKREILKVILLYEMKDLNISILLNTCFDFLSNPNESLAVQVHSMQLLYNISLIEPDIKTELISTIEFMMPISSIGFKSRGNKLLKKLRSNTN